MRFETRAIHVGQDPDAEFGAVSVPIYQTSTYAQPAVGKPKAYDYARSGNPTREALQEVLASLEGGTRALSFSSGLGATTTLLLTLRPGDHVVLGDDVYGGTYRLLARVMNEWGVEFDTVDLADEVSLRSTIRDRTRIVWLETPTNPLMKIVDIERVAAISREAGAMCVVDNTFATPYLQRPLELGADVVVHSVTKYLGGHSDLIGGAIVTSDDELIERLTFLQNAAGAVPGPMDCFLALRGVKTLAIRMEAHCTGAERIAAFLAGHPKVAKVYYPGLPSHPGHEAARRQMRSLRRHVELRDSLARRRDRRGRTHEDLLPRGVARRRRVADRGSRADDPRQRGGLAARGFRVARARLGGDRAPGRPRRRSGAGAQLITS